MTEVLTEHRAARTRVSDGHDERTQHEQDLRDPQAGVGPDGGASSEVASPEGAAVPSAVDLEARAEADPRSRTELLGALDAVEAQRDEYLDDLRRSHADFENYRKRVMREGAAQRELGRADVVGALLDALDDLDRVMAAGGDADTTALTSGVSAVIEKTQRVLAGLGVERVDAAGVPFDPTVHDAVQQIELDRSADAPEGSITPGGPVVHQVLRPGYRMPDRVLRAAMVVVAQ
jgi:molecular chaperone GrpE